MSIIALSATTLVFTWLLVGCGSDDDPSEDNDTDSLSNDSEVSSDNGDSDSNTGGEPNDCDNVTACGGDIVGTWNVSSSCLKISGPLDMSPLGLGESCNATVTGELSVTGTWTVVADGTYIDNTVTSGTETIELSSDCKSISGTVTQCDRISSPLSAGGYADLTCTDNNATGGCTCTAVINQQGGGGIGIAPGYPRENEFYSITESSAGSTITVEAGKQEYAYCVSDNTMRITPVSTGATGTVTGSIKLQR